MENERARPQTSPAENREQMVEAQLGKLRRMQEALQMRDDYLFEVKRELRSADSTLRIQVEALKESARAFGTESAELVRSRAAALLWNLERATAAVERVVKLADETADRLSRLSNLDPGPRRPPVPETD